MTKTFCDICKKETNYHDCKIEVVYDSGLLHPYTGGLQGAPLHTTGYYDYKIQFCDNCMKEWLGLNSQFLGGILTL